MQVLISTPWTKISTSWIMRILNANKQVQYNMMCNKHSCRLLRNDSNHDAWVSNGKFWQRQRRRTLFIDFSQKNYSKLHAFPIILYLYENTIQYNVQRECPRKKISELQTCITVQRLKSSDRGHKSLPLWRPFHFLNTRDCSIIVFVDSVHITNSDYGIRRWQLRLSLYMIAGSSCVQHLTLLGWLGWNCNTVDEEFSHVVFKFK